MRSIRLAVSCALLLAAGCGGVAYNVSSQPEPGVNFLAFRSFSWLDASTESSSSSVGRVIRQAIITDLVNRGMEPLPGKADMFVSYKLEGNNSQGDPAGTLQIQFVDVDSKAIIWRGWASGAIKHTDSSPENDEYIRGVVADVMAQFPPGQK